LVAGDIGNYRPYVASMNRFALILIATLFLTGCDAVSRTELELTPQHPDGSTVTTQEVIGIVSKTAAEFGLVEFGRGAKDTSFTDSPLRAGQNPYLWMTIKHSPNPTGIEVAEMYIASPTERHKRFAKSLVRDLNAGGCKASITYQTPDPRRWPWLIGTAVVIVALLTWRFMRNRAIEKHREFAN
jgi:hypothetical protein